MNAKIIRWGDLPERQYKATKKETQYEFLEVCEEVKKAQLDHKGKWALIKICDSSKAAHSLAWLLNNNRIKLSDDKFEFASRESGVYCRYGKI